MSKKKTDPSITKRDIDLQWLPIDLLVPNSWNPNAQSDLTFNLLKDEIAEVGLIAPIEVVPLEDGTYVILGGEHRWRAAKELGHEEIPCSVLIGQKWKAVDLQKFITIRLNVIHGKLDPDKFLTLYKEMADKYGEEAMQRMMGYADSKEFQRMLGWVKKGLKQSLPKEMAKEVEEATKEVKSVADLENIIQDLFNKYGETVNQSYMIFTYGKQSHIYIQTSAKLRKVLDKVMTYCTVAKRDINDVFEEMLLSSLKDLTEKLEKEKRSEASKPGVEVEKEPW